MHGFLGLIVWLVDAVTGVLANLGLVGFAGLLMTGQFSVLEMCLPLLIVGLIWGIITIPFITAPRAYWAMSPLNVMGMQIGGVFTTTLNFYLAPMIFLMCMYAI